MSTCGKQSLNLCTEVSGDPNIFEKAVGRMSCPEIWAAFSTDYSNLFLVPSNISTEEITAWKIGCSAITKAKGLASLTFRSQLVNGCCSFMVEGLWWECVLVDGDYHEGNYYQLSVLTVMFSYQQNHTDCVVHLLV